MKRASKLLLVAGLVGFAAATPAFTIATTKIAHAQPKNPAPPPSTDAARKLFEEGKRKRDAGDKAGAFAAFKAADDLIKAPTTKLAVARALVALELLIEARQAAADVEQLPKAAKESQPFIDARQSAAELVKDLDGRIPSLTITVEGVRSDETIVVGVTLDGEPLGQEKLGSPMKLNPGKHVIIGTLDGKSTTREVTLAEKGSESVALQLRAPEKPPPPPPPPPQAARPRSPLVYAGLGVAVVGLGVGTVAGLVSMGKTSDVEAQCRDLLCPPPAHDALDSAKTWATVSTIGFIGAGVGLALAGVGFFVLKPKPSASASASAQNGVQLMMTGSGLGGVF